MQFKELKANYIIYVFDKSGMTCEEAKVVSVSVPRFDNKIGQSPAMVVDVTISYNGRSTTYVFPDSVSKAYNGNLTFCINKADIVSDIKALQRASESVIADIDKHRETVTKCHQLLADLDPEQKEKQRNEERFSALEDGMAQIKDMLKAIVERKVLAEE